MATFEEFLAEVNDFGPFQVTIFVLVSLFELPAAWAMVLPLFTAATPEWDCVIEDSSNASRITLPANLSESVHSLSRCDLKLTGLCSEIIHKEHFTSIISEWDLECSEQYSYTSTLLKILQMVGVFLGAFIAGQLADILGRRKVFFCVYSLLVMVGFASAFSNTWQLYVAFRFLIGAFIGGTMVINFVLPLEFVGRQWRTFCGCIGFWALGVATLPLLALLLPHWRHLQMAASAGGLPLLLTYWWVPESPRWLLQKGRYQEASAILQRMAKRNGRTCTTLGPLISQTRRELENKVEKKDYSYWDLFRTPKMSRTTVIVLFAWFVCGCVYYGTTFSVEHLSGNRYLNLFLSGIVELPPLVFVVIVNNKIGRRVTLACLMSLAGFSCFAVLFVHISGHMEELKALSSALAHIGKAGIAGAWAATQVSSAEQFPTVVRNIGIASCSMCARIGAVLAPQIVHLGAVSMVIPYVVYGSLGIMSALSFIYLPETLNKPLMDRVPSWNCLCWRHTESTEPTEREPMTLDDLKVEVQASDNVDEQATSDLNSNA